MDEFTLRHGDETRQELLCAGAGLFEDNKRLRRRVAELEQMLQEEQQMLQQVPVVDIADLIEATEHAWIGSDRWTEVAERVQNWIGTVSARPSGEQ